MDIFVAVTEFTRLVDQCLGLNQLTEQNDVDRKHQWCSAQEHAHWRPADTISKRCPLRKQGVELGYGEAPLDFRPWQFANQRRNDDRQYQRRHQAEVGNALQELVLVAQCLEVVGEQDIERKADGNRDCPWIQVKAPAFLEHEAHSSNTGPQQNAGLDCIRYQVDESGRQTGRTQNQRKDTQLHLESDQGMNSRHAFRESLEPQQQQWYGRRNPSWHNRVSKMPVPEIEKAVQDHDGDGNLKGHAQVFRKNRNNSEANGAHQ